MRCPLSSPRSNALPMMLVGLAALVSTWSQLAQGALTDHTASHYRAAGVAKIVSAASLSRACAIRERTGRGAPEPEWLEVDLRTTEGRERMINELALIEAWGPTQEQKSKVVPRSCRYSSSVRGAIREIRRQLSIAADQAQTGPVRDKAAYQAAVIAEVLNNNFRYPMPASMEALAAPYILLDRATHYVGDGNRGPSQNLGPAASNDQSQRDPLDSTLWSRRTDIAKQDLKIGFERREQPLTSGAMCEYDGPKKGYGIHGGFDIACHGRKFKIRFGSEVHVGPFNSRIFSALGYNVAPFDFVREVKLRYDRRIFTEYNERSALGFDIRVAGFKISDVNLQEPIDPLEILDHVVMKDGRSLSKEEFRSRFFNGTKIDDTFEEGIDHVVLTEASVSERAKAEEELGGWDWNALDYGKRREFRAAGLVAAWVGMYDARWDNTKLVVDHSGGIKHVISDLGSGLGNSKHVLSYSNRDVAEFPWTFIEKRMNPQNDSIAMSGPIFGNIGLVRNFSAIDRNDPFLDLDTDDSKWIARQIAQLTERQIADALNAAGFEADEAELLLKKLLHRRDQLIVVYDLTSEFPLLER